jgi:hypothetical protein
MDAVECNGADVRALFVRELMTASDRQGLRRSTTCCTIVARQQKVLHYQALGRTAGAALSIDDVDGDLSLGSRLGDVRRGLDVYETACIDRGYPRRGEAGH